MPSPVFIVELLVSRLQSAVGSVACAIALIGTTRRADDDLPPT
ncbi:MAG TPA: hypothetical protein VFL65_04480 [Jatrophihabitans sp.]|nr:hypothetical protein [Jatrophihabitans sp.]